MKTYKYQVSPSTESFSSVNNGLFLKTINKTEAINHAKELKKKFKEVSFYTDTYVNGECIKNECAYFIDENNFEVFSIVDYTKKKKSKPLKVNPNIFFDL